MLVVPKALFASLKCACCGGFLNTTPLVLFDGRETCGKCFQIFPNTQQSQCVRLNSLEAVAKLLIFPCLFVDKGCKRTSSFDSNDEHEATCFYRYETNFPENPGRIVDGEGSSVAGLEVRKSYDCHSEFLVGRFNMQLTESKYSKDYKHLMFEISLNGNGDHAISLAKRESVGNLQIKIDGSILFQPQPEVLFTDLKLTPIEDVIYEEPILPLKLEICRSCNSDTMDKHYCQSGHLTCASCKGFQCVQCLKSSNSDDQQLCKNYQRGCRKVVSFSELRNHEANCRFSLRKCLFEKCSFTSCFKEQINHLWIDHSKNNPIINSSVIQGVRIQAFDQIIILICFETIFKCSYFYYKDYLEFVVISHGDMVGSETFEYEITLRIKRKVARKSGKCVGWSNSSLAKGLVFELDEELQNLLWQKDVLSEVDVNITRAVYL